MPWQEIKPAAGDLLSELPSVLTSQAIIFRQAIEKHSFWTDSSGASAGIPRLSAGSFGPGSARAYYDVESNLSVPASPTKPLAGRLYISSDNSRFWGYSSANTIPLGGPRAIVYLTPTVGNNARILVQVGSASVSGSLTTVAFTTAYSTAPTIQLTSLSSSVGSLALAQITSSSATNFGAVIRNVWGAGTVAQTVLWRSAGTVTL